MKDEHQPGKIAFDGPARYRIRVMGNPLFDWPTRMSEMTIRSITPEGPDRVTVFEGWIADQAALSGVLNTLYELHLSLVSVEAIADEPDSTVGDARTGTE